MSKMKANAILNNWRGFKPLEPKIPHHRELQEVLRSRLGTRRQPYHDHLSDGLCEDARYVEDHCDCDIQNGS